jgi:hypothetical protein
MSQAELLKNLVKQEKSRVSSRAIALKTLTKAKILNKKGKFTKQYSNLEKAVDAK